MVCLHALPALRWCLAAPPNMSPRHGGCTSGRAHPARPQYVDRLFPFISNVFYSFNHPPEGPPLGCLMHRSDLRCMQLVVHLHLRSNSDIWALLFLVAVQNVGVKPKAVTQTQQ